MVILKDVHVHYVCPTCSDPVSVYWYLARIPIDRLGIALRKKCGRFDCKNVHLRVIKVCGEIEK